MTVVPMMSGFKLYMLLALTCERVCVCVYLWSRRVLHLWFEDL